MSREPSNPRAERARIAREKSRDRFAADATRRLNERNEAGKFISAVSDEQWEVALERIANGDLDANVMRDYGVSRSTIHAKASRDPEFAARYKHAVEIAYHFIAHDIRAVVRGVEGYSTGDVRRDALIAHYELELFKRFFAKAIGRASELNLTISISPNDLDVC